MPPLRGEKKKGGDFISYTHPAPTELRTDVFSTTIATMGTMYAARGLAFLIARWDGGANIMTGLPMEFVNFGRNLILGKIPLAIFFMLIVIAVFLFIEKKTVLGRFVCADHRLNAAARAEGLPVVDVS